MDAYGKDFEYFQSSREHFYRKYKNEFVAIKNLKIYHDANPLRLQEQLREDGVVDVVHTLIEFIGDVSRNIS
jgi:hypothetical protein